MIEPVFFLLVRQFARKFVQKTVVSDLVVADKDRLDRLRILFDALGRDEESLADVKLAIAFGDARNGDARTVLQH